MMQYVASFLSAEAIEFFLGSFKHTSQTYRAQINATRFIFFEAYVRTVKIRITA